jgi:GNAT superfamily N-acetyltransferase
MDHNTFSIRLATENDSAGIYACDALAQQDEARRVFIQRAIAAQNCFIACERSIVGYTVLDYSFYETGFVPLLVVHADFRKKGVGSALLKHLEAICQTDKLFTSTNLSNQPMQALLARLGYQLSGVIHDLDEGDPELVYVKYLPKTNH